METALLIIAMLVLLFLSGYFSGSEAALFSLSATRLKVYQTDLNPRRRLVADLLKHPRDLLVTVFALNTLVNIMLQNVASDLFGDSSSWILKVGVPLVLTLIFGEIIPKYIGLQNNVPFSLTVAPVINWFMNMLAPILKGAIKITTPLSRVLFFYLRKEPEITTDELQHILKTSEKHGIFNADEGELILGYLDLQESTVRETMRPREDILFFTLDESLTKLAHLFSEEEYSRVPVCDKNLDQVLGIMTARTYLVQRDQITNTQELKNFLEKPLFVPETTPARRLMRRFHEQEQTMALVVDEYGTISGIITREDLIEVFIGKIADPRDQKHLFTHAGKNEIIASGKLELEEFNKLFDVSLESPENMVTIGGWLTERLGEIPKSGSKFIEEGFLFQILASTGSRIRRMYIRKLDKQGK